MKTNKSFTKRIKVTKNGKLVARKPGHNHFNAKESGTERRLKHQSQNLSMKNKARGRFLNNA
jgi:ribosomal protein L35